jgi:hypothetical protein
MAKKPRPRPRAAATAEARLWVKAITAVMSLADRLGIAFTVMIVLIGAVYVLGDDTTENDFIRELLFGEITGTRTLAVFMVSLAVVAVFGADTFIKAKLAERAEMKRISDEKSYWQEKALGTDLSHTGEGG